LVTHIQREFCGLNHKRELYGGINTGSNPVLTTKRGSEAVVER